MPSIFSRIIAGEIPCYKVAEDDRHIAFLDVNPVAPGHTLVVPKREESYIFDLSDEELAALNIFAKKVAKGLAKAVPCKRVGVTVIGLEVPHAHIHLIPINKEADMSFNKERPALEADEMTAIAASIAAAINVGQ
jgi:histidine triad (HIT) family protein